MLIALARNGIRRQPIETGERTVCETCGAELVGKHGDIKVWHWAHLNASECDPWAVGEESAWHLGWKALAMRLKKFGVEQTLTTGGEKHRADIRSSDGRVVIEVQHSPLSTKEMDRRTDFWSQHGVVVWVLDAGTFGKRWTAWNRDRSKRPRGWLVLDRGPGETLIVWPDVDGQSWLWPKTASAVLLMVLNVAQPKPVQPVLPGLREASLARARAGSPVETTGRLGNAEMTGPVIPVIPVVPVISLGIDRDASRPSSGEMTEEGTPVVSTLSVCRDDWTRYRREWVGGQPTEVIRCLDCGAVTS